MKHIDLKPLQTHLRNFVLNSNTVSRKVLLVRSAESQGNLAGTLTGWTDVKLSDFGRKQAFTLNAVWEHYAEDIKSVHSSDLARCKDTAFYMLGFPSDESIINHTRLLREIHFGHKEGLHYDGLSDADKEELRNPHYQAPGGESWDSVRDRATEFFRHLHIGNHLVFTHGGLITAYLHSFGITHILNNCSVVGITLNHDKKLDHGQAERVEFVWEFPHVQEDI